jgi:hypothetical protein
MSKQFLFIKKWCIILPSKKKLDKDRIAERESRRYSKNNKFKPSLHKSKSRYNRNTDTY